MIVGHKKIIQNLKRLADTKNLAHGYIFFGSPMIGKRLVAESLMNYLETGIFEQPRVLADSFSVSEAENATIGIGQIREIIQRIWQQPYRSFYRVALIDNAQVLTQEAQNALLKVSEEPPAKGVIILTTSDQEALAPTLRSRFQSIYFSSPSMKEVQQWLMKTKKCAAKTATETAVQAFGQPGRAIALLENEKIQEEVKIARSFLKAPAGARKELLKTLIEEEQFQIGRFLDTLIWVVAREITDQPDRFAFWHKLLELRKNTDSFNLNPRLQLEALFSPTKTF